MKPESMDKLFHALASRPRREMLDIIKSQPGCSVVDVCKHFDVSRIAVMKHLAVLEAADLVIAEKPGRAKQLYFNAVPIQAIYDRWTTEFSSLWAGQLTAFKHHVENKN